MHCSIKVNHETFQHQIHNIIILCMAKYISRYLALILVMLLMVGDGPHGNATTVQQYVSLLQNTSLAKGKNYHGTHWLERTRSFHKLIMIYHLSLFVTSTSKLRKLSRMHRQHWTFLLKYDTYCVGGRQCHLYYCCIAIQYEMKV